MKQILLTVITVYQKILNPLLHQLLGMKSFCRSNPTCSTFAKEAIVRYGAGKGIVLSMRRIINCQQYFSI